MGKILRYLHLLLLIACCGALSISVPAKAEEGDEEILVGRIAHVEGKLLRYIDEEKDWVLTVKDSPFGLEDALYSGEDSKAEFIMPNGTWLRVGENTQIQLIALNPDATTIDLASGLSRLYNKGADTLIKVTTPFGYVVAPGGTAFDLYVGDESLEVIAISGDVDFIHEGSKAKYLVREGSSSIIANEFETDSGNGAVDAEWDDWNAERDKIWDDRLRRSENSAQFLPEAIRAESHVLEENGRWDRIHYEGEYRDMWRPTRVESGWRPFTAGRWTVYYGDNCWIPDEDFGYVTHHYGSWVYIDSFRAWYWMPPIARLVVDTPGVYIRFGWFPGRVGWIHSGPSIGWVPLAPRETYYGSRHWGHRTVVVKPSSGINININIGGYRYINDAVVVHRDHFYRGNRYTQVYERNISRDVIVNNYRPTTIINNTVINNVYIDKRRYTYNDVEVIHKPHTTVINRINDNHRVSRGFDRISRQRIEGDLKRFQTRKEPSTTAEVRRPRLVNKIVAVENIAKPIKSLALEEKELKPKRRERERPIRVDFEQRSRLAEKDGIGQKAEREKADGKGRSKLPKDSKEEEKQQLHGPQDNLRSPGEGSRERKEKPSSKQKREEIQSPREQSLQADTLPSRKPKEVGLRQDPAGQEESKPRLRSPRDKDRVEADQILSPQDRKRSPEEKNQTRQEQRIRKQPDEDRGKSSVESSGRQGGDLRGPREQRRPSEESITRKPKADGMESGLVGGEAEEKPRIKPPRDKARQDAQAIIPPQNKGRKQDESQVRQEKVARGEKQDGQQLRQKEEKQNLRQIEAQRQQEQGKQQRQEQDKQLRREEDKQRQQQESRQLKEREEKQRLQQVDAQRRQEQEKQQRQLQEKQVSKEQGRKTQEGPQVQQRQESKRQREAPVKTQEPQAQQEKKKKKKQQEEEQLQGQQPTAK